jgi:SAM-dependent methyltransferase
LIPSTASIRGTDTGYRAFHAPRYRFLLELIDRYAPAPVRVLDIGLSPFTTLLRAHLDRPIDSLGLEPASRLADGAHYQFDLNALDAGHAGRPPLAGYDVIVYAEVLEHLHTPPLPVLRFLHDALAPNGVLLLQTPNAASLFKRVRLLFGIQPQR